MKALFVALLLVHGLLHFIGPAAAVGIADPSRLSQPVSREAALVWVAAGLAMLSSAVALVWSPRHWWSLGLVAVLLSQTSIISAWGDAKLGTLANVLVLAAVVYGFASQGPASFREAYRRAVQARLADAPPATPVAEPDVEHLPTLVRRYLRATGALHQPRVHNVRARWSGRIRAGVADPWMELTGEQHDFVDEPARFFHMSAIRSGLPVDVLHEYHSASASMRVRLLSLFPLVSVRGPELRQAETVTVLNDMCLLAPGALIDERISWEELDDHRVCARYTVGSHTISAVLVFNDAAELVDFVSEDRLASADGGGFRRWRWSTPVSEYRTFGALRVMGRGEARWHAPEGEFTYIELELLELQINVQDLT
jgi:hypothetical protein